MKKLLERQEVTPPRLIMEVPTWLKMMAYISMCPTEVNGFGVVSTTEGPDGDFIIIDDVFITPQEAGAAHVTADPELLGVRMRELGIPSNKAWCQWHSHVNMDAYFSGTDTNNIERWPGTRLVSLVLNKSGKCSARLDYYRPRLRNIPLVLENPLQVDDELRAQVARDLRDNVHRPGYFARRRSRPAHSGKAGAPFSVNYPAVGKGVLLPPGNPDTEITGEIPAIKAPEDTKKEP